MLIDIGKRKDVLYMEGLLGGEVVSNDVRFQLAPQKLSLDQELKPGQVSLLEQAGNKLHDMGST